MLLHTLTVVEQAPASGCNFYSDGHVFCTPNCSGYESPLPGGGFEGIETCNGSSVSGGYASGSGTSGLGISDPNAGGGGGYSTIGDATSSLTYAQKMWDAARRMQISYGKPGSTRKLLGAPYRSECVAAIQQMLKMAGLSLIGSPPTLGVDKLDSLLPASGYAQKTTANAVAGDIISYTNEHSGVCLSDGCTEIISNSSGSGSFSWLGSLNYYNGYYHNYNPLVFHHG